MTVTEVLELARQREEQARSVEEANLAKQQAKQTADEERNRREFLVIVWQAYEGAELDPTDVLNRLDKCNRTANELNEYVAMLEERQQAVDWLAMNPQTVTVESLAQDIKDAEKAYEDAGKHLNDLHTNYQSNRAKMDHHDSEINSKWQRIREIETLIPIPEDHQQAKG